MRRRMLDSIFGRKQSVGTPDGLAQLLFQFDPIQMAPIPILFFSRAGKLLTYNAAAEDIAALYDAGGLPFLGKLVIEAAGLGEPQSGLLVLAPPPQRRLVEVTAIPGQAAGTERNQEPAGSAGDRTGDETDGPGAGTADASAEMREDILVLGREATLEHNLRDALIESRRRFKDLVELSSDFAWETDSKGRFVYVSAHGALGWRPDELLKRRPADLAVEQPGIEQRLPFDLPEKVEEVEVFLRRREGDLARVVISALPLFDEAGRWRGARGIGRDVTHEREQDAALSRLLNQLKVLNHIARTTRNEIRHERILATTAEATSLALGAAGCFILRTLPNRSGFHIAARFGDGPDFQKPLHLSEKDSLLAPVHIRRSSDAAAAISAPKAAVRPYDLADYRGLSVTTSYRFRSNGAILVWRQPDAPAWSDDDSTLLQEIAGQIGITIQQIVQHEELKRLSSTDSLTGLANRRTFFASLGRRLIAAEQEGQGGALVYIDMDNFKAVNDHFGHRRGDEVLQNLTDLLLQAARPEDIVARLGGDEFCLWLADHTKETATDWARSLLQASLRLRSYSAIPEQPVGISVGIALFDPQTREHLEDLVGRGDAAMYRAKHSGKSRFHIDLGDRRWIAGSATTGVDSSSDTTGET